MTSVSTPLPLSSPVAAAAAGVSPGAPASGETRERIVGSARRRFLAEGFRAVTMEALAQELGMSKKTFYTCFPGKTALVEAVIHHKFDDISASLEAVTGGSGLGFPAKLEALLAIMRRQSGELQPPFLRDLRRDCPGLFAVVQQRRAELIQRHFGRLLKEGREAGMVRRDVPLKLILEILMASVEALITPAKLEEFNLTPKSGLSTILKILLEGLLTKPTETRVSL